MNKVAKIDEMEPETFERVMDANVTQSWLMARAATTADEGAGRGWEDRADVLGARACWASGGYTAYCASKAAVDGITKALGCELGPTGSP